MIGAIVARIYYKILTIENISLIGRAAICSLSLYVTVGKPVLFFQELNNHFSQMDNWYISRRDQ